MSYAVIRSYGGLINGIVPCRNVPALGAPRPPGPAPRPGGPAPSPGGPAPRPGGGPPALPAADERGAPAGLGSNGSRSAGMFLSVNTAVCEWMYRRFVSGSNAPPGQFAPPTSAGSINVPIGPFGVSTAGGVNKGPRR